jgi:23S rRNA pseudouridine1911/1915/1917 synthase
MEVKVKNLEGKERLDKYLAKETAYSRALITKMIHNHHILVNDKEERGSYLVNEGDLISLTPFKEENNLEGTNIPLDVIYEDDHLMVINKQSGLVVHPGNGNKNNTLVNALIYRGKHLSSKDDLRPGIVHRIDKDTSGLMLVAKDNQTHEILADDFKHKRIKREYIALLDGVFPNSGATIDAPIGRDLKERKLMTIKSDGKKAITHLTVLKKYPNNTLVSLILDTGRTHQIRVHMKYIGYPVHNDPVYGTKKSDNFGQFLHSAKITFLHPVTGEKLSFEAPLPKEFQAYLNTLEA